MINLIAAVSKNNVIGKNNRIPWDIKEDRQYFKKLTLNNVVIMGRKTFESLPSPLPDRITIVVSSKLKLYNQETRVVESLKKAIELAEQFYPEKEIFICGGAKLYEEGLKYAQTMYITQIDNNYEGDTYFPNFNKNLYNITIENPFKRDNIKLIIYKKKESL